MFLVVVLILIVLLILYLLFVPIDIYLDTYGNQYYLQCKGLLKINLEADKEELLRIKLRTFFMKFYFYPLKNKDMQNKKQLAKKATKKKRKIVGFKRGIQLIRSFKLKQLTIDLDTGDCISNAKLFPVFSLLNHHFGSFHINFEGRNTMALHLQNRPINIIRSFINF